MPDSPFTRGPMQVPHVFIDDTDSLARAVEEWMLAGEVTFIDDDPLKPASPGLVAVDFETDYDETLNLNIEVAKERVLAVSCFWRDADGLDPEALIVGDDIPEAMRDLGYSASKTYVVDLAYVDYEPLHKCSDMLLHVWNKRFERKVFANMGIECGFLRDLMLFQAALDQGANGVRYYTGLARATDTYLGWDLEGKGGIQLSYRPKDVLPQLSDEQKAYAAQDAVATALLAPMIMGACAAVTVDFGDGEVSLFDIGDLESGASSFLDKMQVAGVPLATDGDCIYLDGKMFAGWLEYCTYREGLRDKASGHLADIEHELSGDDAQAASQGLLPFGDDAEAGTASFEPSFEPGSHKQLIAALNRLVPEQVKAYTAKYLRADPPRLFTDGDTVDKSALKLMGGELSAALREWGKHNKLTNDSGQRFVEEWINPKSGRLHPEIKQAIVATGRLAMEKPAMQNRPPELKRFHRPSPAVLFNRMIALIDEHGLETLLASKGLPAAITANGLAAMQALIDEHGLEKLLLAPGLLQRIEDGDFEKLADMVEGNDLETLLASEDFLARVAKDDLTVDLASEQLRHLAVAAGLTAELAATEVRVLYRNAKQVVLYADLSQAELRTLAHMSQDERMLGAFRSGQDLHTLTATEMFQLDIEGMMRAEELSDDDLVKVAEDNRVKIAWTSEQLEAPEGDRVICHDGKYVMRSNLVTKVLKEAKLGRGKAKVPNFGVAYGMSGPTLARTLCLQGVDTSPKEGNDILEAWMDTYPGVKKWLLDRDAYIDALASNPPACDYASTWKLLRWHKPVTQARFALKKRLDRFPTPTEIADRLKSEKATADALAQSLGRTPTDEELAAERQRQVEFVEWVLSFRTPVVVAADGTPFAFASRTLGGRRRLFQVSAAQWLESQAFVLLTSDPGRGGNQAQQRNRQVIAERRAEFARRHRLTSIKGTKSLGWRQARKAIPKNLHQDFVTHVLAGLPAAAVDYLGKQGLSDRIKAMKQQFRNAPIQGTVGDVALHAYALLDKRLARFGSRIQPVLTVHDSIMLVGELAVAREGAKILQQSMEEALEHYCPSVPAKADAAILFSFDEGDPVDERLLDLAEALEAEASEQEHEADDLVAA